MPTSSLIDNAAMPSPRGGPSPGTDSVRAVSKKTRDDGCSTGASRGCSPAPATFAWLAESCPHCGRDQTLLNGWWQANSVPETRLCIELTDRDGNATRCSGSLESARTLRIPTQSALLDRQQQILDLLPVADISCGIYREQPVSSSHFLIDIRALSMRLLDAAPAQRLCGPSGS